MERSRALPALQPLTIGELSRRTGVAASALRFYEERGLIQSERTPAGHRRYARATARRVAFILFAQRIGLSLEEIGAELAKLPTDRVPTGEDWASLSATWTARIDERIAELERLRGGLGECIGCGCLSLERCAILNPGDRAGRAGPGARYWLGDARPGWSSATRAADGASARAGGRRVGAGDGHAGAPAAGRAGRPRTAKPAPHRSS